MAPEVICKQNHGVAVDYFAVGVMVYEFMLGRVKEISCFRALISSSDLIKGDQGKRFEMPFSRSKYK